MTYDLLMLFHGFEWEKMKPFKKLFAWHAESQSILQNWSANENEN